ncbi:cobyrinate a,c-diamide synthase [Methylobacterium aerolatum]|uniref:Hydrogenobyrinate a,c-diamide synthase n=1 Tax=Methylobacterium aerolatum TaxID=418708 RepID=A0ABU0HTU0_9HYPH|nr:cobyrinate a,c-diamide synthase [Methylobacterium aerolatum]MDQ0445744.1 cobyrinic acid a,c-diamide synthase [Methylobacterium aerolatum]GJD35995.1 Hydrogenobyrinate a,c-diamide synthase [Methylobacterium aerolatum]
MSAPGLLIAAPRSGSGKTTVTLAVMRALWRRGLRVRGAKCGPDYIDPAFHRAATGEPSLNLDSFAMAPPLLDGLACAAAREAQIVIAEGSMGLFDGVRAAPERTGANADIAARYRWPVVLVVDVSGAAQSAAAVALGCRAYDPRLIIAGVILNKVASARHRRLVEAGMERAGIPILGALSRDANLVLPERHLGLVQAGETADLEARLERLADLAEGGIDLDALVATAGGHIPEVAATQALVPPGQRIAIAQDAAFSFLYPHMEIGWRAAGAELRPFSPLADEAPPADCDACWLPGGYPELHAGPLAAAGRFLGGVRDFARTRPVHGECGGYMVLGQSIEDAEGVAHPMLGLLPVATSYRRRKLHLGYRVARLLEQGVLGRRGACLVGHEFHYASELSPPPDAGNAFAAITDAEGTDLGMAGHRVGHVTGSFFHLISAEP